MTKPISIRRSLAAAFAVSMIALPTLAPAHAQDGDYMEPAPPAATGSTTTSSANFTDMLSGKNMPLRIRMKDLTPAFRRIVAGGGGSDTTGVWLAMVAAQKGVEMNVYYTKGYTVKMGGETYLIAYRPQMPVDPNALLHHGRQPLERRKPSANTPLALSLLNLRTSGSFTDVRPFDPKEDVQTAQEGAAASVRQLTTLGQGVLTYVRNRGNGVFPQIGTAVTPANRRTFYPFVHDERKWINPANEEPYRPNPALSGKRLSRIANARLVPMFYEGTPQGDGTRAVLFVDGHVERLSPERFTRVRNTAVTLRAVESPAAVTSRVKAALAANAATRDGDIDVSVNSTQQTVTLTGTAKSAQQSWRAQSTARQAATEYRIVNRLSVRATKTTKAR